MKTAFILLAITSLSIISFTASAQFGRGLHHENNRIRMGVINGRLTGSEFARLKLQEARLRNKAFRYKANDGRIGPVERADLRRDHRKLNRNICRQKHDRQRRRF